MDFFGLINQNTMFIKIGPIPASFCLFSFFLITISIIQIEKSVDGVLGIRTRGRRMVGADETTELLRPPVKAQCLNCTLQEQSLRWHIYLEAKTRHSAWQKVEVFVRTNFVNENEPFLGLVV